MRRLAIRLTAILFCITLLQASLFACCGAITASTHHASCSPHACCAPAATVQAANPPEVNKSDQRPGDSDRVEAVPAAQLPHLLIGSSPIATLDARLSSWLADDLFVRLHAFLI